MDELEILVDKEGDFSMKTFLTGILVAMVGMALCGVVLAQETSPSASPSPTSNSTQQTQPGPATTPAQSQSAPVQSTTPRIAQPTAAQAGGTPRIAPGSVIPVQLTKSIDAKKAKSGDPIEAKVTQDLKATNGDLIVPKDTKMVGHVTEAQARNKEQKESEVSIAFDRAVMKNGGDIPLPMSIQAIIAPPTANPENSSGSGGQSPAQPSGAAPGSSAGRPSGSGMGNGAAPSAPTSTPTGTEGQTTQQAGGNARPPITGNTQGVVGISNLKLAAAADATQGSVVSSEKNNVKLDSGTLLLLRVNP